MATVQKDRGSWFVRPAPGVVRMHLEHLRDPLGHFDLPAMERELRKDVAVSSEGLSAVTLVKYPDLRIVLIALRRGGRMHQSRTRARVSLQTLRGNLELHLPDGVIDIPAGGLATLESEMEFEVLSHTESALLLTLAWPSGPA